jgi:hypothetical protein
MIKILLIISISFLSVAYANVHALKPIDFANLFKKPIKATYANFGNTPYGTSIVSLILVIVQVGRIYYPSEN